MKDPIIQAIREIRRQYSIELERDPIAAIEKTRQRVLELATDFEWLGPGVYRANYRIPEKEFQERLAKERELVREEGEEVLF